MPKATLEPIAETTEAVSEAVLRTGEGEFKQLTLDQIVLDKVTDVRFGKPTDDEKERIESLAKSMYMHGQIQPVLVRPNGTGDHYLLIAGRRRLAAKKRIAELVASGKYPEMADKPVTINAIVVERTDDEAWATSLQENLQRRDFSPIEFANNIMDIRKRRGWNGDDWTDHVAAFLMVSRATVSQHVKLLKLDQKLRTRVHNGTLSMQAALQLLDVPEPRREAVLSAAENLQAEEERKAPKKAAATPSKSAAAKGKTGKAEPEPEAGRVKHKHVLEAARRADALSTIKPRNRTEVLAFFTGILESTDPYPDPIVNFCQVFGRFASGHVGERAVLNKLDIIADLIADKSASAAASKPRKVNKAAVA